MKIKELRQLTNLERGSKAKELLQKRFHLCMKKGSGQLTQTHLLRETRKDLARLKTIERERILTAIGFSARSRAASNRSVHFST